MQLSYLLEREKGWETEQVSADRWEDGFEIRSCIACASWYACSRYMYMFVCVCVCDSLCICLAMYTVHVYVHVRASMELDQCLMMYCISCRIGWICLVVARSREWQ